MELEKYDKIFAKLAEIRKHATELDMLVTEFLVENEDDLTAGEIVGLSGIGHIGPVVDDRARALHREIANSTLTLVERRERMRSALNHIFNIKE